MTNWYPSSFRARRTLATAVVATLVCVGVSLLFLLFAGGKEAASAQMLATGAWNRVVPLIRQGPLPPVLPDVKGAAIQVVDAHGRAVAATSQLAGKPPIATFHSTSKDVRAARVLCPPAGLKGCMTVVSYKVYQPEGVWLLYVAVPVVPWYGDSTALLLAVGVSLLVITMMTAWTFRDLSKALAPVNAIRTELAEITATGLDRRVPVPRKYDEIKSLAETVNDTLDRLEGAYQRLRRFTSDASHDLRSPITAMRTQLEEALMYPQDTDWPKMTVAALSGLDRLQAIVTDLLTLARLDARAPLSREPTELDRLVGAELDRRTYRVEIVKDLRPDVLIDCDRLRITRVLVNLLDNAERHATSQITVSVRADGPTAILEVVDDGTGIAVEHREMVFDRFTRLDASRDRDAGGTGLGLAIAREIAEAHQGTLTIEDSERGARFVLRLPARAPSPAAGPGGSSETRVPSADAEDEGMRPRPPARGSLMIPNLREGEAS
ncbi:sensor histidine kinase [Streptosporangium lutulentum]|uniref:histidine kinase n=1 Tax=Streptosporangium lutulentum TaxID=1461250 RepID=A0ABT9QDX4_9ACTN|nr:HAMP domain-containing sensor histidine kinase [Streptosporangium lutulentum]MDP9844149.1 signal transduction histidine kinase [Streptosporangium lutulentum]